MGILGSLLKGSTDALFIAESHSGNLVYVNQFACHLLGFTKEELIGRHQSTIHPPEELEFIVAKFKEFVSTPGYKEVDTHVLHRSGRRIKVRISSSNNFEEDGVSYVAAFFKDLTSEVELSNIAFIQSHVVRAPICNIIGLLDVFDIDNFQGTDEQRKILRQIQKLTFDLDEIVKDIVKKANKRG